LHHVRHAIVSDVRRYLVVAHHRAKCHSAVVVCTPLIRRSSASPRARPRARSMAAVTGLARASGCIHPGSRLTGANAELVNTSGRIGMNTAACTASGSPMLRPIHAENEQSA